VKKWVVNIYDLDGHSHKSFTKVENAIKYLEKQVGQGKITYENVNQTIRVGQVYRVTDEWGRYFEVLFTEVGYCKVCKKQNKPLYGMSIKKGEKRHPIQVCSECMDSFECGGWTIKEEQGKIKVVTLEY